MLEQLVADGVDMEILIKTAFQEPTTDMLQELVADGCDIHQKISFEYFQIRDIPLFYGFFKKKYRHVLFLLDLHLASPPRSSEDTPEKILEKLFYWQAHNSGETDENLECQAVLKVGRHCTQATLLRCVRLLTTRLNPRLMQTFITAGADVRKAGNLLSLEMVPECMQILIEHGMDVNYQSPDDKSSAIHHVIQRYFFERAYRDISKRNLQILLVHGADLSLRDANGKTALDNLTPAQLREFEGMQANLEMCRGYARKRILAFSMAGHRRLGANSPAQQLSGDMFHMIMGAKKQENYLTLKIAFVLE